MGKKKYRRSKSSPGEWKRSDSFDSEIEESPNHDHQHHHHDHYGFSWSAVTNIENLKKKDESESAATINVNFGITVKSKSLGVSVNFNDEKVGEDFPIFKHFNSSSSSASNSSTSLPPPPPPPPPQQQQHQHHHSFSHSSSGNSSISLRIPSPSPNVSSVSNSSAKKTSHSYSGEAHQAHRKKSISGESSGGLENSFELTFPVSDFGKSEPDTFVGRMKSIMQSPPQVQAMERSGDQGYDPHRIPSAIFETNRTIEWSATSNESLFSLNLGRTNSLSPEKLLAYGDHMIKAGELDPLSAKFTTPRTSDSDHSLAYRISDVEIDLLKKIEEDEVSEKEIENANQEPIIELSNEVADGTNNNRTDPNSTNANSKHITDNIPSFKVEELSVQIALPKLYKNTEESVKSGDSFSFQVVEDEPKARDRRPNSLKHIKMQQSFPNPKSPYHKQKAKSKSWFSYCLSCCGLCSCLSVLCCNPCSCCSGGSSCLPSCKCPSCSPSCTCSYCAPSCTCSSCAPSCNCCSSCSLPSCNCCSCSSCSLPSCNCCSSCSLPSCTCKSPCSCGSCSWCCCFSCSSCRCFSCSGSSFCCCGSCRGSRCCC